MLQDWTGPVPLLTLEDNGLELIKFVYLGSCVTAGGGIGDEIFLRISKARMVFAKLKHLWRRRDIRLSLKGSTVRSVLLYGCETWPLRVEDIRRLDVFESRCLGSIARISWHRHVDNETVRRKVLGTDCSSLGSIVSRNQLRWLGHVLRMPIERLPFRALLAHTGPGWKKPQGGQQLTWRSRMKKLTASLTYLLTYFK